MREIDRAIRIAESLMKPQGDSFGFVSHKHIQVGDYAHLITFRSLQTSATFNTSLIPQMPESATFEVFALARNLVVYVFLPADLSKFAHLIQPPPARTKVVRNKNRKTNSDHERNLFE